MEVSCANATAANLQSSIEHLKAYFVRTDAVERMKLQQAYLARLRESLLELRERVMEIIRCVLESPASPGYEPLLVQRGMDPAIAWAVARLLVCMAIKIAEESKWRRPVYESIRFLVRPGRQMRAISARAVVLLEAREQTWILGPIFYKAGISQMEFIGLLKSVVEGKEEGCLRLAEIAAAVAPHLSLPRGPKISAESVAHELLLESFGRLPRKRRAYSRDNRAEEYVDPATEATRREFGSFRFENRSARRRLRRRL